MNTGTKLRTVIGVIMLLNEALIRIGTVDFGNETSNLIYRWLSFIVLVAAYVASHWYNNDYTEEAALGTGVTRQLKEQKKEGYIGETFAVIVNDPNGLYEADEDDDIDEDEEEDEQDDI